MPRTFKYRLYPNRKQRETLAAQLDLCRELYNAALQERIASYQTTRKGVPWLQQQSQLPAIKEVRPEFKSVRAPRLVRHRCIPPDDQEEEYTSPTDWQEEKMRRRKSYGPKSAIVRTFFCTGATRKVKLVKKAHEADYE
jgi:hypothetical protein